MITFECFEDTVWLIGLHKSLNNMFYIYCPLDGNKELFYKQKTPSFKHEHFQIHSKFCRA